MSISALLEWKGDKEALLTELLEKLHRHDSRTANSPTFRADIPSTWLKELAIELARELSHEANN